MAERIVARIFRALDSAVQLLTHICGVLSVVGLLCLAIFVSLNVVLRYVGISLPWLFSVSVVALIFFAFFSVAFTLGEGKHTSVDVLTSRMPKLSVIPLEVVGYLTWLVFAIVLVWQGLKWVRMELMLQTVTASTALGALEIPVWILGSVVPIGAFLLVLQAIRLFIRRSSELLGSIISHGFRLKMLLLPVAVISTLLVFGVLLALYVHPLIGLFIMLLTLLLGGIPVAVALAMTATVGLYVFAGGMSGLSQVAFSAFSSVESFPLVALPLFVLVGTVMSHGGLAERLFSVLDLWFARVPGSLLVASIITGAILAAITGSSIAATAILSIVCLGPLISRGFDKRLSCGTIAGASMGSLIPPSIALIVYGAVVEASIGKLFMAALVPSLIVFAMFTLYVLMVCSFRKEKAPRATTVFSWKERMAGLAKASPIVLLPIIILGGIYAGVFTATEAAAIAVVYCFAVVLIATRTLKWSGLKAASLEATCTSSMTLWILIGGVLFSNFVSQLKLGPAFASAILASGASKGMVVSIMFVILAVFGMFTSSMATMLMTLPFFYPLAMELGISVLWLGVLYNMSIELGLLTPPVGVNLYIIQGVGKLPFQDVVRGMLPFLGMLILGVILIYFMPDLVDWLPSTM